MHKLFAAMHKLFTACPTHGHFLALRRAAAVLRPAIGRRHSGPGWSSACSLLCLTLANWRNCPAQPSPAQPSPAQPTDDVLGYFWRGCCVLNSAAHMLSSPSMGTPQRVASILQHCCTVASTHWTLQPSAHQNTSEVTQILTTSIFYLIHVSH